jgi:5-methylcytosine-specific restriction protein A
MGKNLKSSDKGNFRFNYLNKPRLLFAKPVFASKPRSSKWKKARAVHLELNGMCLACGGRVSLEVHHLMPYHLAPELELDPNNLITLCESASHCHWTFGHLLNWRSYNPNAKADAIAFFDKVLNRPKILT